MWFIFQCSPSCSPCTSSISIAVFVSHWQKNPLQQVWYQHMKFSAHLCIYKVCLKCNGTGVTNHKLHGLSFKVIHFESSTLSHPSLSRFCILAGRILFGWPSDSSLLLSWWLPCFPWWSPWAWEKKEVPRCKIREIGRLFQYNDVPIDQELSDAQGIVGRCIVVVKQPRFVLPQDLVAQLPWWLIILFHGLVWLWVFQFAVKLAKIFK